MQFASFSTLHFPGYSTILEVTKIVLVTGAQSFLLVNFASERNSSRVEIVQLEGPGEDGHSHATELN